MRGERGGRPAFAGLGLGVPALGPALGPGFVLRYDMVFVPDPPLRLARPTGAFPRAVPSDLVVAAARRACVPARASCRRLILLGIFVLAAAGAAALVPPAAACVPRLARPCCTPGTPTSPSGCCSASGRCCSAYAGLPWAVRAAALRAARGGWRSPCCPPRSAGSRRCWSPRPRCSRSPRPRPGRPGRGLAGAARGGRRVLSLPWLVPALLSGAVDRPGRGGRVRGPGRRAVRHGRAACSRSAGSGTPRRRCPARASGCPRPRGSRCASPRSPSTCTPGAGRGAARPGWWAGRSPPRPPGSPWRSRARTCPACCAR